MSITMTIKSLMTAIYSNDKDTGEIFTTTAMHRVTTNDVVDDGAGRTHPV